MKTINGTGLIGVNSYPNATGLFLVLPTEEIELKEGFYSVTLSKNLYTNFNPSLVINEHSHISYQEFDKLTGFEASGTGIAGLMTSTIWPYKKHPNGLFY